MKRSIEARISDIQLLLDEASLQDCLRALDQQEAFPVPSGSVEVAFVSEEECCRLHDQFFGDPEATDVMTFPGDPEDNHAGDIAICPWVAHSACLESKLSFSEELTLYLVHAWLHLSGLDDKDEVGRSEMRKGESVLMEYLSRQGALLRCSWST